MNTPGITDAQVESKKKQSIEDNQKRMQKEINDLNAKLEAMAARYEKEKQGQNR